VERPAELGAIDPWLQNALIDREKRKFANLRAAFSNPSLLYFFDGWASSANSIADAR